MKKSLLSIALIGLMASSAFAYSQGGCPKGGNQPGMMQGKGMQSHGMQSMHGRGGDEMHLISKLDLTDEQRHQLAILRSEMRLEMTKLHDPKQHKKMQEVLTAESFDKKGFIASHNQMHEKRIALKANHMEKVFNLLTKEQRAELKKLMDERPMRGKRS